jgi:methylated-DNA-[protein]-cysteine S-methyltransferase
VTPDAAIAIVSVATPWGPAALAAGADGLHGLGLLATSDDLATSVARRLRRPVVPLAEAPPAAADIARAALVELDRYAAHRGPSGVTWSWRVPIRFDGLAEWDRRVLTAVGAIGWGATASYGEIARAAGSPGAARAVGGAVGRNPIGLVVPCHRVIAADGTIGGYGGTWPADREQLIELKRSLLAHEGVELAPSTGPRPRWRVDSSGRR